MNNFTKITALVLVMGACASCASAAKAKPKSKTTTPRVVKGTTQLPGEWAVFGTTYTLGKSDPINITMNKAEYTVEPVLIGERQFIPQSDQKLLVIHFNIHNPQANEKFVTCDDFPTTCVDSNDQNWEYCYALGSEKTKESVSMSLKPAQKMDVYTAILVPAAGEMPKLIIKSADDMVLRYDLRGKVKGIPAPFSDPKDKTGATALEKVTAQIGTYYPLGQFDVKLDSFSFSTKPMPEQELEEGARNLIIAGTAKNRSKDKPYVCSDTFTGKLLDTDGVEIEWGYTLYAGSRDSALGMTVEPGQEFKFRYVVPVQADVTPKSLAICEGEGRLYEYDLTGVN